jgi:hypothetical protein
VWKGKTGQDRRSWRNNFRARTFQLTGLQKYTFFSQFMTLSEDILLLLDINILYRAPPWIEIVLARFNPKSLSLRRRLSSDRF